MGAKSSVYNNKLVRLVFYPFLFMSMSLVRGLLSCDIELHFLFKVENCYAIEANCDNQGSI